MSDAPGATDDPCADGVVGRAIGRAIGAVFVGGGSRRMGTDKALMEVRGRPLAERAVDALRAAGLGDVLLIGADVGRAELLGGRPVADIWPGEGPLGGLVTALEEAERLGCEAVMCLSCDLPGIDATSVQRLWRAATVGPGRPVATVVTVEGRSAPPNGVWPVHLGPTLRAGFQRGERALGRALAEVAVACWDGGPAFEDVDTEQDVRRFLERSADPPAR